MNCASCGAPHQPGQRFCAECGARLARACSSCGEGIPGSARFCPSCGAAVAAAADVDGAVDRPARTAPVAAEAVAERRLVSVLFCDLVGFTGASEDRDAEQTRDLLTVYYDLCRERVERYGGSIEKFIGDAVMAVWGVPVAHEDDAERAVRAALELVAAIPAVGPGMTARAAVVTGEAAVTLGAEGQGMVAGDLVNTASRLQGHAGAGSVLVSSETRDATERAIEYEHEGEIALRGREATVGAWRALRTRAGIGGRLGGDELEPPFVGRDAELRMLIEMFHATARESRLRLVSVTGQAGIGKSRLSRELESYLDGISQGVFWHRGRCPAYGDGLTYWAVGEMVRRRAGVAESDPPDRTAERIGAMLAEFVTDPEERARLEPALRALVGLETRDWSAGETGELYVAWRTLFERIAEQDPVVLVFEDVQWADVGLVGFIEHLLEWSRNHPVLVVTLARPEFLEEHPTWGAGQRNFVNLHLEPLPAEAITELLAGMVPGLPKAAAERIAARAEGVPLYAVETLRMLLAQGVLAKDPDSGRVRLVGDVSEVAVPDSLRGLVAARLDLLPPTERALIADAAVLGHSFPAEALAAVTGQEEAALEPSLRELVRRELLRLETDPRSPERGQYLWVQAVLREVAYATLAKRDRRIRHVAAARYFDALGDEESAAIVADHYLQAWRASAEGGEREALAGQARVSLRAAAERAERLRNSVQAARFLDHELELTEDLDDRVALLERAGDLLVRGGAPQAAEARYRGAMVALPKGTPADDAARIHAKVASVIVGELRIDEAIAFLEPAVTDFGAELSGPGRVMLESQLGRAYFLDQRSDDAEIVLRRTIEAAERIGPEEALVEAIVSLGTMGMLQQGRQSGLALLFGGLELAHRAGFTSTELRALNNLAVWALGVDPPLARELVQRVLDISTRTGYDDVHVLVDAVPDVRWVKGLEAAARAITELSERVTPGTRDADALREERLVQAHLGGAWETWEAVRAEVEAGAVRSSEVTDWQGYLTAMGLMLQDRLDEADGVISADRGPRTDLLGIVLALLRTDRDRLRTILEREVDTWTTRSLYGKGMLALGRSGLALLEATTQPDVDAFLEGVSLLRRSEIVEAWTMSVVTLVGLVGAQRAEVERAVAELRAELDRLGARGAIEALERALVAITGPRDETRERDKDRPAAARAAQDSASVSSGRRGRA